MSNTIAIYRLVKAGETFTRKGPHINANMGPALPPGSTELPVKVYIDKIENGYGRICRVQDGLYADDLCFNGFWVSLREMVKAWKKQPRKVGK